MPYPASRCPAFPSGAKGPQTGNRAPFHEYISWNY